MPVLCDLFTYILQGCFAGTGAIVWFDTTQLIGSVQIFCRRHFQTHSLWMKIFDFRIKFHCIVFLASFFETKMSSFWWKFRHWQHWKCQNIETKMSSFWWNFLYLLHRKLSKWQFSVQPVMKISSKITFSFQCWCTLVLILTSWFAAQSQINIWTNDHKVQWGLYAAPGLSWWRNKPFGR